MLTKFKVSASSAFPCPCGHTFHRVRVIVQAWPLTLLKLPLLCPTWLIKVCCFLFFFSFLKSFNVDLLAGKSKDIALHLNPRLNIKAFIRNSFLQESWGEEERNITSFPFSPGMYFEVRLQFLKMGQHQASWEQEWDKWSI